MPDEEIVDHEESQDSSVAVQDSPSEPQHDSSSQQQPGQQAAQPQAQVPSWAVMENFRRLPQFQGMGEQQIAQSLYQAMQREQAATQRLAQYQQYMPYTQQYLADKPQYEAWKKSQQVQSHPQVQAAGAVAEKPKSSWWNPPEVKDSHKQYLIRDPETGKDAIHPDAPLEARQALAEYQSFKTNFAKQFLEDPEKALGPMVEGRARQIAESIVQGALQKRDNESFVDQVRDSNSDWIFDEQGNVTPEGLAVHKYVEQARSLGITSPQDRWKYARDRVEYELLLRDFQERQQVQHAAAYQQQQFAQQPPQPQAPQQPNAEAARAAKAQQNMEYLRREAARSPSRSAGTSNNDPRAPKQKQSFEQMLIADASSRGII